MTLFSLAFVANAVHRRGGQERAAAEVLSRVSERISVTVIARECELPGTTVKWLPIRGPARPSFVRTWAFARAARVAERRARCTITNSIGAAALDADVITAQFCHAAFTARFGGIRGGSGIRAAYQRLAQAAFVAEERRAYGSPRLQRVIAVSHGTARELREHYGVAAEKIVVVPNGVDHAVFHPAGDEAIKRALRDHLGLPQATFLALFVGGDWERKGVRDAIDAVAGIADTMLVILGSGDERAMGAYAARAGAARRVRFAGLTHAPQDWYAACDAFVFPSRYEAFSLVTLEAAASGLPIVAHAINGTEELVADGANGWLVPFGADALREKLALLRDDSSLLVRMSAAAVTASQRYGWDRIADEQFAVLETAAARAGQRGERMDAFVSRPVRPQPEPAIGAPVRLRTLQLGMEWFPEKPGGLNRVYYEITRHLEDVNVEVHGLVAGSDAAGRDSGGMVEGFAPHAEALLPRLLAVRRMARPLLRGDPGMLFVTHFALYAAPLLGELHGRPMVVHFHGPWGLEGEAEQQSAVTVFTKSLVERAVYRRATSCIVLSRPFGAILERLGVAAGRIHVIPGGVDASRFATGESRESCRAHFGWPGDRPIVLTVRRLMRRMGLDNLVAAAELLRARVPNVLVLIAGRGPMADELHAKIQRKALQDHVRLIGFVADEDLPRAYRAADLTVVPSVALEGFGLVVAESLAAGTPCLVTPVGGLPEAVHGLSPHLILADTGAQAIADGVAAALTGTLRLPSARECAEFARTNYDWPVIAARTRQVYEEALR